MQFALKSVRDTNFIVVIANENSPDNFTEAQHEEIWKLLPEESWEKMECLYGTFATIDEAKLLNNGWVHGNKAEQLLTYFDEMGYLKDDEDDYDELDDEFEDLD